MKLKISSVRTLTLLYYQRVEIMMKNIKLDDNKSFQQSSIILITKSLGHEMFSQQPNLSFEGGRRWLKMDALNPRWDGKITEAKLDQEKITNNIL